MYGVVGCEDDDKSTTPIIQGSTPAVFQTDVDSRGRDIRCQGIGDNRYSGNSPGGPRDAYRPRDLRGHYVRPDHNRRKFDPSIICDACKPRGHPASQCDLLAQAIFLTKYMKHSLTDLA
jgi:hypothetical protein